MSGDHVDDDDAYDPKADEQITRPVSDRPLMLSGRLKTFFQIAKLVHDRNLYAKALGRQDFK